MTTIYSYIGDEMTLDGRHFDLRCVRAGATNTESFTVGVPKINAPMVP